MPYQMVGEDNYIDFLRGRDDVARCPVCKVPTHPFDHGFPQKKVPKNYDLSNCFEGFELASPRLKAFLEEHCTSPVEYFETGGGYFILRPKWAAFEDLTVKPETDTGWKIPVIAEDFCETCGRFNSFHGKAKGLLKGGKEVGEFDLFRTVQELGPKMQKNFGLVAGDGLVKAIKAEKFKGVAFVPY